MFDTSDSPKYFRQNCILTASDQVVNEQPEACDRAVKALQLAVAFIAKNPDKAVEFVAARTKTSTAESRQALTGFDHGLRFDQALLDDLVNQSEWAIESNLAKRPADDLAGFYRQLLYVEGLRKVDPDAVTL